MRGALSRSGQGLADLFLGAKVIDDALLEELETALLMADVGVATSEKIIRQLTEALDRRELADVDTARAMLEGILIDILRVCEQPLVLEELPKPAVILMVGVNGVGKTSTIGKLCGLLKARGLSTVLAAGDTFRAAAVEQFVALLDASRLFAAAAIAEARARRCRLEEAHLAAVVLRRRRGADPKVLRARRLLRAARAVRAGRHGRRHHAQGRAQGRQGLPRRDEHDARVLQRRRLRQGLRAVRHVADHPRRLPRPRRHRRRANGRVGIVRPVFDYPIPSTDIMHVLRYVDGTV